MERETTRIADFLQFCGSQIRKRDETIARRVRMSFMEMDWAILHTLLQKKINHAYYDKFPMFSATEFSSYAPGSYYFNVESTHMYPRQLNSFVGIVQWYFTGEPVEYEDREKGLPKRISPVAEKIQLLEPATFESKGEIRATLNIHELLSFCDNWGYSQYYKAYMNSPSGKIYAPKVKLTLPNRRKPIITSLGLVKGYWEDDDMCDSSNRYEIAIGKNPLDVRVSMKSGNSGIPDGCK